MDDSFNIADGMRKARQFLRDLVDAHIVMDGQRFLLGEDRRAGVPFFIGAVPVYVIPLRSKINLPGLQLGFLQAKRIGVLCREILREPFAHAGA